MRDKRKKGRRRRWYPQFSLRLLLIFVPLTGLGIGAIGYFAKLQIYGEPPTLEALELARLKTRYNFIPNAIGLWQGEDVEVREHE